jgi:8-oxo-dGTP diphosphatase
MNQVRVWVGAYIINSSWEILLWTRISSHGKNTLCPPGWHLEFWETIEECAVREIQEETGWIYKIDEVSIICTTNDIYKEESRHYITLHTTLKYNWSKITIKEPDKMINWKWYSKQEIYDSMDFLFPSFRYFIQDETNVRKIWLR